MSVAITVPFLILRAKSLKNSINQWVADARLSGCGGNEQVGSNDNSQNAIHLIAFCKGSL
jgi:hypothetical protein